MMPSLKRGATFSVNSARARVDFTKPSPHSRAASCAQEFERGEAAVAAVAAGRIIAGWHLINVVISSMGTRNGGDCDGMLAGTSANACSEEPKRTENMKMKDQSAYWISVQRSLKIVNGIHCFYFTKVNSGTQFDQNIV